METTELAEQPNPEKSPLLVLTPEAQYYLQETGKWANFLGIVGFILCALFLIMALCIGAIFSMLAQFSPNYSVLPTGIFPVNAGFHYQFSPYLLYRL